MSVTGVQENALMLQACRVPSIRSYNGELGVVAGGDRAARLDGREPEPPGRPGCIFHPCRHGKLDCATQAHSAQRECRAAARAEEGLEGLEGFEAPVADVGVQDPRQESQDRPESPDRAPVELVAGQRRNGPRGGPAQAPRVLKTLSRKEIKKLHRLLQVDNADQPYNTSIVEQEWPRTLRRAVQSVLETRGQQVKPLRIAELFSGCASSGEALDRLGIRAEVAFTCDCKMAAWQFTYNSKHKACHFLDVMKLIGSAKVWCCRHGKECNAKALLKKLHVMVSSFSCQPYSLVRSNRLKGGTTTHPDANHCWWTLTLTKREKPWVLLIEYVWGMGVEEKRGSKTSPLKVFVDAMAEELPTYIEETMVFGLTHTWTIHQETTLLGRCRHRRSTRGPQRHGKYQTDHQGVASHSQCSSTSLRVTCQSLLQLAVACSDDYKICHEAAPA